MEISPLIFVHPNLARKESQNPCRRFRHTKTRGPTLPRFHKGNSGGELAVAAWQLTEADSGRVCVVFLGDRRERARPKKTIAICSTQASITRSISHPLQQQTQHPALQLPSGRGCAFPSGPTRPGGRSSSRDGSSPRCHAPHPPQPPRSSRAGRSADLDTEQDSKEVGRSEGW